MQVFLSSEGGKNKLSEYFKILFLIQCIGVLVHLNLFSACPSTTAHFYHFYPQVWCRTEEELT